MNTLGHFLRRFRDEEDGVVAVELLLVIPILVWALLSTLVYFDAYQNEAISTRAGLTLADAISRERSAVDDTYITNMRNLLRVLTRSDANPALRVTVYRYRATGDRYIVVWSKDESSDMGGPLTTVDLETMRDRLPIMADGDRAILVETRTAYTAPFSVGMGPFFGSGLENVEFNSLTVITPRFLDSICYDPTPLLPLNADDLC